MAKTRSFSIHNTNTKTGKLKKPKAKPAAKPAKASPKATKAKPSPKAKAKKSNKPMTQYGERKWSGRYSKTGKKIMRTYKGGRTTKQAARAKAGQGITGTQKQAKKVAKSTR